MDKTDTWNDAIEVAAKVADSWDDGFRNSNYASNIAEEIRALMHIGQTDQWNEGRDAAAVVIEMEEPPNYEYALMESGWCDAQIHFAKLIRALRKGDSNETT